MRQNCHKVMVLLAITVSAFLFPTLSGAAPDQIDFEKNDGKGQLTASAAGKLLFVYNYGENVDLPHFYPFNTPSGKNLLEEKGTTYPHHRSFWVADTVTRDGVKGDVYNAYYSGRKIKKQEFKAPFNTGARHLDFTLTTGTAGTARIEENLVWETSRTTDTYLLLDEHRDITVRLLDSGYLMDFTVRLTATYGDVEFRSDAVHYAWPFLRINSDFSVAGGGTLASDSGTTGQLNTNLRPALWIDYSNTVQGLTEGVAMLQWPDGPPRLWLTRDYGTFGPRRPEHQSGKPFTLARGESLQQRVGIFVHSGDASIVPAIYQRFIKGEMK